MRNRIKRVIHGITWAQDIWHLALFAGGNSLMTGIFGWIHEIPLMYIWVGMIIVFAYTLQVWHWLKTPSKEKQARLDAFHAVYAESFRITYGFQGDLNPFFNAMNRAKLIFFDDKEVQDAFVRFKEEGKSDVKLMYLIKIIQKMGSAVGVNITEEQILNPIAPNPEFRYQEEKHEKDTRT